MTFILAVNSRDSIWVVADRQLTWNDRIVKTDAIKLISLNTKDGIALIVYAGLGATVQGT